MSDEEDLELQALQRQLDDAFQTTRPRRGFEDDLWLRLQARRPFWSRLRDGWSGFLGGVRELPTVPTATVATVLILAVGLGILAVGGGFHLGGGNSLSAGVSAPGADRYNGQLPTPALHPGQIDPTQTVPAAVGQGSQAASNLYFGPATLSWGGTFPNPNLLVQAPVLIYREPGQAQADAFAGALGASTDKQASAGGGFLGVYSGQGFTVRVFTTVPQLPREPFFVLAPVNPSGGQATNPADAAAVFLSRYGLTPPWPSSVTVQVSGEQARVQYNRVYQLPDGVVVHFVDWNGDQYGIKVDLNRGVPVQAAGPLPISLQMAYYPLITNDHAVNIALNEAPAGTAAITPTPIVKLDQIEVVYALAVSGGQGFYEPAYLFSGSFQYNGQTYVKRVLVPLVDPSLRSSGP